MSPEPPPLTRRDGERRVASRRASAASGPPKRGRLQDGGNGLPHTSRTTLMPADRAGRVRSRCPSKVAGSGAQRPTAQPRPRLLQGCTFDPPVDRRRGSEIRLLRFDAMLCQCPAKHCPSASRPPSNVHQDPGEDRRTRQWLRAEDRHAAPGPTTRATPPIVKNYRASAVCAS